MYNLKKKIQIIWGLGLHKQKHTIKMSWCTLADIFKKLSMVWSSFPKSDINQNSFYVMRFSYFWLIGR